MCLVERVLATTEVRGIARLPNAAPHLVPFTPNRQRRLNLEPVQLRLRESHIGQRVTLPDLSGGFE